MVENVDKERLGAELVWLQGKFKDLLVQQQSVLVTLSNVLTRLDALEKTVDNLGRMVNKLERSHAKY